MAMSMVPLLMHSESVPIGAREALRSAGDAEPARRDELLLSAARILHRETGIACADIRELIGLPELGTCG